MCFVYWGWPCKRLSSCEPMSLYLDRLIFPDQPFRRREGVCAQTHIRGLLDWGPPPPKDALPYGNRDPRQHRISSELSSYEPTRMQAEVGASSAKVFDPLLFAAACFSSFPHFFSESGKTHEVFSMPLASALPKPPKKWCPTLPLLKSNSSLSSDILRGSVFVLGEASFPFLKTVTSSPALLRATADIFPS